MTLRAMSYRRTGRLTAARATGLRAGAVLLKPGRVMDWHSTRHREELMLLIRGRVSVEIETSPRRIRRVSVSGGGCLHLPSHTRHRVVNRTHTDARYVYVTG